MYILVPTFRIWNSSSSLHNANLSFIISTSNVFQMTNINKTIMDTTTDINKISFISKSKNHSFKNKLYISCINECPLSGIQDIESIIDIIIFYCNPMLDFNIIMLSDTCGSLTYENFKYIIDRVLFIVPIADRIGLHLHVKDTIEVEKIIHYALSINIIIFDVSIKEYGGCSLTIKNNMMYTNLNYEKFYKYVINYLFINSEI